MGFLRTRIMGGGIGRRGFPATDVPSVEADALIRLYNATNGDSWTDNTNWKTDTTVGNWYGITVVGGHVTEIDLHANNLDGDVSSWSPEPLTALDELWLYANSDLNGNPSSWTFPASTTWIALHNSGLSGDISSAVIPANVEQLYFDRTSLYGSPDISAVNGLQIYRYYSCLLSQAQVDAVIDTIYGKRADFTDATPELNIGGTNAVPSGTYQSTCPPTTALEQVHQLANDGCTEGINTWAITYRANGGDVTVP